MGTLNRDELIERSGVSGEFLTWILALALVQQSGPGIFATGDLRRVRLFRALDDAGLPLEAVSTAVRAGDLSFAFFDWPFWERFGGLVGQTLGELSTETGLSFETLSVLRASLGFAPPDAGDRVRGDELPMVGLIRMGLAAGADPAALERQVRVWGESVRRMAEADANFYHTQFEVPLLRSGLSESQMMDVGSQSAATMAPLLDDALISMYHAQSEHTWLANVVEAVESTLERTGLHSAQPHQTAICFLDLTGYTRLTEERGDVAAAELAASLTQSVYQASLRNGGRPVKWLGDGVMISFDDPHAAVVAALEMVEEIPRTGLPPAHVGIDAGTVIRQDGDYFGRTVNMAARIAGRAIAAQVLVSEAVLASPAAQDLTFVDQGLFELKGVSGTIRLYEAHHA